MIAPARGNLGAENPIFIPSPPRQIVAEVGRGTAAAVRLGERAHNLAMRAANESPIVVVPSNVSETALRTNLPNGASDLLSCLDGARKVDRFWPYPGRDNAIPLRRNDYALPTLSLRVVTDNCDSANSDVYSGAMRRLDRYILGQVFWWTIFVTICLICVVWLSQSLQFVEMIINRGLTVPMFIYFTALLLPTFCR